MSLPIITVTIRREQDIVLVRHRARQLAELLQFDVQDQTRIATAVSEIARNSLNYAKGGKIEFIVEGQTVPQLLLIQISDRGPGIENLTEILAGRYQSRTGMGVGLIGARRLMDRFHIDSTPGQGTVVYLRKILPRQAPLVTAKRLGEITAHLARDQADNPLLEVQRQNQELLQALTELRTRQEELQQLNRELEDTNRGVVALYAELDEKADHLRRADEMKSRFLSNMSHEFRTPLNSQLALTRLLLERLDGDLTPEQEKQVMFIRKGAETLLELVNDLLDIAKIEAGKIEVRASEFTVTNLFSALRGMLRPLLVSDTLELHFDEPSNFPILYTDEAKVSQILRNFLSNAIKFTERGEVRVSASLDDGMVTFAVRDTGIGIAPADQARIFEEFTQVEHPLQARVKGTGLGLPLCRKLADLLGGTVSVQSQLGAGSTFQVTFPCIFRTHALSEELTSGRVLPDDSLPMVMVIDDNEEMQFLYRKYLSVAGYHHLPIRSLREARQVLGQLRPQVIVLDILLRGEDAWLFLAEMKSVPATSDLPILVITTLEDQQKALALGADAYAIKPVSQRWLLEQLARFTGWGQTRKVLVVDDQEAERYLIQKALVGLGYEVVEASSGEEALHLIATIPFQAMCLDLMMPEINGWSVLQQVRTDPTLHAMQIIVISGQSLNENERQQLDGYGVHYFPKADLTREVLQQALQDALTATPNGAKL